MRFYLLIIFLPISLISQVNYNITVNSSSAYNGNLFFHQGGTPPGWNGPGAPPRPVKILDSLGNEIFSEVWGKKGWDFKVNINNTITFYDRLSKGWFVMDSLQNIIDSVYAKNGYIADNHDFLALENGNYVLFCYDEQPYAMDTVVVGGNPNAVIEGLVIQELDSNHNVIFEWKSWDHFHITDNQYLYPWTNANLPFIHTNSIDIDFDGHFIISNRNLDEVTKINRTNGEIIWRWGGSQNEFVFVNDYPFTHQHTVRSLGNNRYLMYDNGNFSSQYVGSNISRAVEYVLDTVLMTATKVWEFVHPDSLYTPSIGSAQRLPNGNTLINFGNLQSLNIGSIITEVDSSGQIVFQLEYDNGGNLYRAHKFNWFFQNEIFGCTDSLACNYNQSANFDDSSCCYNSPELMLNVSDCDFYIFDDLIYDSTGIYTFSFSNNCGCDSIVVLDLEILNSDSTFIVDTAIDYYNFNDNIIFNSGNYVDFLINSDGCDSIVNLELVILNETNVSEISFDDNKKIVRIVDLLGRESNFGKNKILFYIYKDGFIRRKVSF